MSHIHVPDSIPELYLSRTGLSKTLGIVFVLAAVGLTVTAPFAIPLLFSAEFADAVGIAIVLTFGMVLRNLVQMAQNLMMGVGRPAVVMYSEWTGLGTLLGLILWLAPRYGLNGVAAAVVTGNALALAVALVLFTRWTRGAPETESATEEDG